MFTSDNMTELRPSRATIVVASGLLTTSDFDTAGVGEDIRAAETELDSPAGPGRPSEVGNSVIGSYDSVFSTTELEEAGSRSRNAQKYDFQTLISHRRTYTDTDKMAKLSAVGKIMS